MYFNPPPSPPTLIKKLFIDQPIKAVRKALNVVTPAKSMEPSSKPSSNVVLVTGVTSPVGRRLIAGLLRQGRAVRALCADNVQMEEARALLGGLPAGPGGTLEFLEGSSFEKNTSPGIISPHSIQNIQSVVYCSSDTSGYIKSLLEALPQENGRVVYTPSATSKGATKQEVWGPLNDVVMGGVSDSSFIERFDESLSCPVGVFVGNVSTANNGGFASVRTRNFAPPLNLSAYDGLYLRLKGDGSRYKLILRSDPAWDGIGYTASFDTVADEWQTIQVPFAACVPVFRARTLSNASPLNTSNISSIQLMLSKFEYDGALNPKFSPGRFELPIQAIGAFLAHPITPRFIMISVGENREAENVVRSSGVPYTIIRPVTPLLEGKDDKVLERKLVFGQGEALEDKAIESVEVAEVGIAALTQPSVNRTTFQLASVQVEPRQGTRDWWGELAEARLVSDKDNKTVI